MSVSAHPKKHARPSRQRRPRPQFDPAQFQKDRWFERWFLQHRGFNVLISQLGKIGLSSLIWPRFVAPFRWQLTRYAMPLAGIGETFVGYRLLQLSDLHVGKVRLDYLESVFRQTVREKPDLIAITGDLIDYDRGNVEQLERLLPTLLEAAPPPTASSPSSAITITTNIPGATTADARSIARSSGGFWRFCTTWVCACCATSNTASAGGRTSSSSSAWTRCGPT